MGEAERLTIRNSLKALDDSQLKTLLREALDEYGSREGIPEGPTPGPGQFEQGANGRQQIPGRQGTDARGGQPTMTLDEVIKRLDSMKYLNVRQLGMEVKRHLEEYRRLSDALDH